MAADSVTIEFLADGSDTVQAINRIEGQAVEASTSIQRLGNNLENALAPPASAGRINKVLSDLPGRVNRVSSATGRANQVLLDFGQGLGDAAFGIQGVANNIPMVLTGFQRLQDDAGGTLGAFKNLGSTLMGFGGVVLAANLIPLLAKATDNLDLFSDEAGEAEEAQERLNEAAERFFQIENQIEDTRFPSLEAARQGAEEMEQSLAQLEESIQDTERELEIMETGAAGAGIAFSGQSEEAQILRRQLRELRNAEERLRNNLELTRKEIQKREAAEQQRAQATAFGAEVDRDAAESTEDAGEATEETTGLVEDSRASFGTFAIAVDEAVRSLDAFWQAQRRIATQEALREDMQQFVDELRTGAVSLEELLAPTEQEQAVQRIQDDLAQTAQQFNVYGESAQEAGQKGASAGQLISMAFQGAAQSVRSLKKDSVEATDVLANILSTVGAILAAAGTVSGPVGAAIGGAGALIGSFQHGGRVDTPFQIVGESGPELAMLPQGTQVASNETLNGALQQLARGGGRDRIHVTGRLVGEGGDLVAVIDEQVRLNGRNGQDTTFLNR